ncbi:hypothetical protein E3N88_28770 [Mikania micrantha]|uniref:TF-B3 domain-containing protein n=1 Tax=Mikania micrantha TaxID=192012 RepID=A0A5N6N0F9_9ASTR|nr:hypothetical protein E3N88_28770 [Mikania micrantha]
MDVETNSSIGGEGEDIDIDYLSMFSSVPESHDKFIQRMKLKSIRTKSKQSTCFFMIVADPSVNEQIYVNAKLSPSLIKIQTLAGLSWIVNVVKHGRDYFLTDGWKKLVDQLFLSIGSNLLFEYEESNTFRLTVHNKPRDDQIAILPLNENEICGVLEEEDEGDDDDEDAVTVGNLHLLQPGTSRSVPTSRPYNVCEEAAEDGVVTFERKVECRLHIVRSVKNVSETTLKMRYFKAEVRSYRIRKTKAVDDRFVLDGWCEFMDEYGIVKGEKCSISYYTNSRLLVCAKEDDTDVILRSKSKGKSLKLSSSSSENATSFILMFVDASRTDKSLPVSFKNIVSSQGIQPSYFKIQTKVGLSWFVKLVKEDGNYLLSEGWKVLVDQLNISLGSYIMFEYEEISTFTIAIFPQQQALHVGSSFYTIMLNRQNDEVIIPTGFLSKNYAGKVPPGFPKLQSGKDLKWKVNIEQHGKNFFVTGWKKVMDDIPLHLFSMVIFNFVSSSIWRMSVFKPFGIQAMLPLQPNEKCGYDVDDLKFLLSSSKSEKAKVKFNHRFMQNVKKQDDGVISFTRNVKSKTDERDDVDDVIVFARDVDSRMRLPIGVVRALVKSGERRLNMRFEEGEVNEFQVKVTDGNDPRYVLEGWKEFMIDNDIKNNQLCRFKFYKSKLLMVVSKLKEVFSV